MAAAALRPCRGYKRLGSASAATVISKVYQKQGSGHINTSHWACFEEWLHATMWPHCKVHHGCIHLEVEVHERRQENVDQSLLAGRLRHEVGSPIGGALAAESGLEGIQAAGELLKSLHQSLTSVLLRP
jgi:hypothetical protein